MPLFPYLIYNYAFGKKHYEITFIENESLLVVSFALFC